MWEGLTKKMGQKKPKKKKNLPSAGPGTRQRGPLPSAKNRALGEEVLCRVPGSGTRQRNFFKKKQKPLHSAKGETFEFFKRPRMEKQPK